MTRRNPGVTIVHECIRSDRQPRFGIVLIGTVYLEPLLLKVLQ